MHEQKRKSTAMEARIGDWFWLGGLGETTVENQLSAREYSDNSCRYAISEMVDTTTVKCLNELWP